MKHAPAQRLEILLAQPFEVEGETRWIAELTGDDAKHPQQILIVDYNNQYFSLPLHCPHQGKLLSASRITDNGELICPDHGLSIRLGDDKANSFPLYREGEQFFFKPSSEAHEETAIQKRWQSTSHNVDNEINALKAANSALEQQLIENIEKMDGMLTQVEARKKELEQTNETLASLYELIDGITDSINEVLIVTDSQGVIIRANRYAEQILECEQSEIIGAAPDLFISQADRLEINSQLPPSSWDQRPLLYRMTYHQQSFEREVQLKPLHLQQQEQSKHYHYLLRGTLLYSPAGKEQGMILTATDITRVKAKEDKIRQQEMQAHLELMQATLNSIGQGVAVFDHDGRLRIWNDNYPEILNYPSQLMITRTNYIQLQSVDKTLVWGDHFPSLGAFFRSRQQWCYRYKKSRREVELESFPIPDGGFVITAHDVTIRRRQEERVRMLSHAVEQSPTEIVITDPDGSIVYANPMFTHNTGYSQEEALGSKTNLVQSGEMPESFYEDLWNTIEAGQNWRGEIINRKKGGEKFWQFMAISPIRDETKQITHYLAVKEDISKQKAAEAQLKHQADHDNLTQLPNRVHFHRRVNTTLQKASEENIKSALLFLDLDNFKDVNDTLGHQAGDLLLQAAAKRLVGCIREEDTIARLGGDEFAIIQSNIQQSDDACELAERIIDSLRKPYRIEQNLLHLGVSIGIAMIPDDGNDADALLSNSDVAMYAAKHQSGSTYRFYDQQMYHSLQRRRELEICLRKAAEQNELHLVYQPKVSISDGTICGVEALLRWHSGELGIVSPDEFIPIAESTGLIGEIGDWVLTNAIRQIKKWRAAALPIDRIAVNISPVQIKNTDLPVKLDAMLKNHGLPATALELEITETAAMTDPELIQDQLNLLRLSGIKISLDDFGTGYSSLSHLVSLPIDHVKIDRSFINDIEHSEQARALVESIIRMSQVLNKQVIAEGVETESQLQLLQQLGCNEAQGYLIAKPLTPEALAEWLARRSQPH